MPDRPSDTVRSELGRLLHGDGTRVGDVYRLSLRGLNPHRIAQELQVNSSNFVSNNRAIIKAVLDGEVPGGPQISKQAASVVRRLGKSTDASPEAKEHLLDVLHALERAAGISPVPDSRVAAASNSPKGSPPVRQNSRSLRLQVDEQLRRRVTALIERIRNEARIDADDYHGAVVTDFALDEVARLVGTQSTSRTTKALHEAGRLDLSLEQAVIAWSGDLPLTSDVVSSARGRLAYWRSQ